MKIDPLTFINIGLSMFIFMVPSCEHPSPLLDANN